MLVVYDEIYGDHLRGVPHPESPDRALAVASFLQRNAPHTTFLPARDATDDEIARVHSTAYLETVKREVGALHGHATSLSTGDTVVDERSLAVARRAAGGAIAAVEHAVSAKGATFALIRPPGHHAESTRGMGFCIFNNAAIAARAFLAQHGGRVLIVDFDYHHGNGTQAVSGAGLSYVSTHAYPAYPGTGSAEENYELEDAIIANVPLSAHAFGTEPFVALWERLLPAIARRVKPTLIIASAGFDYVAGDPVGDLGVDVSAASDLARLVNRVAREYADGKCAFLLEGGYNIGLLSNSVYRVSEVLDANATNASDAQGATIPAAQDAIVDRWIA